MRIVIDVTQLVNWQGKLTGIPRVMYELASRFSDAEYIRWDNASQLFEAVESIERKEDISGEGAATQAAMSRNLSKRVLRKLYHHSPSLIKKQAILTRDRFKGRSQIARGEGEHAFIFERDDELLVLWGDWGDSAYRLTLRELARKQNVRITQLAYDMLPLITPQYSSHSTESLGHYVDEVYPICNKIIAISQCTKRDVQTWMVSHNLTPPPIDVIRLGDDFQFAEPKKPDHTFFAKRRPYILCVGTIEARKNHTLLYYVYKLAYTRGIKLPKIVIVGRRGWLTENTYDLMTTDPEVKDMFIFMHNTSDEELSWVYDHALFSVYPSLYEGWGLPIAESVARNVPCICSNTSSMPEVAGKLVNYFTPTSSDECLSAIVELMDVKTRQAIKKQLSTYHQVSWETTFQQVVSIMGVQHE